MYPKIEEVNKIIEQMEHLSPSEKTHLSAMFHGLSIRQEQLFESLKQEVKSELAKKDKETMDVYIVLAGPQMKKELGDYHFYEICPDADSVKAERMEIKQKEIHCSKRYSCGIVFWKGKYEELSDSVIDKKYAAEAKINGIGYEIEYYFRLTDVFIRKEKEIQSVCVQYQIEHPALYNPMARRAAELIIEFPSDMISKNDSVFVDLCLERNKLNNKLIFNHNLYWNIADKESDELPPAKTGAGREVLPLWDHTFQIYRFPAKNRDLDVKEFILVHNDLRAVKRAGEYIYWQLKNDYTEMTFKRFSVYSVNETAKKRIVSETEYFFCNGYEEPGAGSMERIRTKGDAFRAAVGFHPLGIACRKIFNAKEYSDGRIIYTYPKSFDYYQARDERLKMPCVCKICFDYSKEDYFFVDKVSYIVGYMNYRYPEYQWIGVV